MRTRRPAATRLHQAFKRMLGTSNAHACAPRVLHVLERSTTWELVATSAECETVPRWKAPSPRMHHMPDNDCHIPSATTHSTESLQPRLRQPGRNECWITKASRRPAVLRQPAVRICATRAAPASCAGCLSACDAARSPLADRPAALGSTRRARRAAAAAAAARGRRAAAAAPGHAAA